MNTIVIPTTQNIELEYPIASLGERMLAEIIDLAITFGYIFMWLFIFGEILETGPDTTFQIVLIIGPAISYPLLAEFFFNGQTLGKRAMKTKVIQIDGSEPTLSSYLLRWLLRFVEIYMFSGLIAVLSVIISKKGQRLGDLAAGTTVVKLKLATTFEDTMFMETEADHEIMFPEIRSLSDRDVAILKEVLDAGLRSNNPEILEKLSEKVKEVALIQTNMPPKRFLHSVLEDYNHIFGRK